MLGGCAVSIRRQQSQPILRSSTSTPVRCQRTSTATSSLSPSTSIPRDSTVFASQPTLDCTYMSLPFPYIILSLPLLSIHPLTICQHWNRLTHPHRKRVPHYMVASLSLPPSPPPPLPRQNVHSWTDSPNARNEIREGFDQEAAAVLMARLAVWKTENEEAFDILRWLDRMLIRVCARFADYGETPESFNLPPNFLFYPQFMFYLRRSQFLQVDTHLLALTTIFTAHRVSLIRLLSFHCHAPLFLSLPPGCPSPPLLRTKRCSIALRMKRPPTVRILIVRIRRMLC